MSKIISTLIGKQCKIQTEGLFFTDCTGDICTVIDADDEWMKISYTTKKNVVKTKILRIDLIENIEEIND